MGFAALSAWFLPFLSMVAFVVGRYDTTKYDIRLTPWQQVLSHAWLPGVIGTGAACLVLLLGLLGLLSGRSPRARRQR